MDILAMRDAGPPTPKPITLRQRWRVAWHGRRDARLPVGETGEAGARRPYLDALRAEAEAGQRAVTAWLHDKIVPVDREAVQVLTVLDQARRDPPVLPDPVPEPEVPPPQPDSQPTFTIPAWVVERRRVAAQWREYRRRIRERDAAEQRLGQLGNIRHHLLETARAAARAHLARFDQLVALYETALVRRNPGHAGTDRVLPAISPEPWVHGDMPLLALEVDAELSESYRWYLKEFERRTSVIDRQPIPAHAHVR